MKNKLTFIATSVAALSVSSLAHAQDPFSASPANARPEHDPQAQRITGIINIRYETFSLDLASAASLMRANNADSVLYQVLTELAKNDKARQESLAILRALSGQRAKCESIAEYIYPTEWDPAEIPNNIGIQMTPPNSNPDPNQPENKENPGTEDIPLFTAPSTPTAFETRNVGFTLEADVTIDRDDNQTIQLSLAPEHVTLAGISKWGKGVSQLEVPDFEAQKLTTTISARAGLPRLLGTMNRPPVSKVDGDSARRIWFAFVTVSHVK